MDNTFQQVLKCDRQDEREKLKEDFDIAREEIESLKTTVTTLQHELCTTKKEAASFLPKVAHIDSILLK